MEKTSKPKNILVGNAAKAVIAGMMVIAGMTASVHAKWTYQGVCYDADWENRKGWYGTGASETKLKNLHKLGVNAISVTPFAYQYHVNKPNIHFKKSYG